MIESAAGTLTLVVCGTTGYFLFKKLRLPLPALLGSLSATAALALTGNFPSAPIDLLSGICKIVIGMMMGRRMNRNAVEALRHLLVPATLISAWMIALSIASGLLLSFLADMPLSTTLIGSATGGVSEMAIFALSKNYDVATITIIGVTRLVAVLILTPWVAHHWSARLKRAEDGRRKPAWDVATSQRETGKLSGGEIAFVAFLSVVSGVLLNIAGVPAGLMIGALCASSLSTLSVNKTFDFHPGVHAAAQIGIGIVIARQFGPEQLAYLTQGRFIVSLLLSTGFIVLATLVLAYILQRITGWEPLMCLLASSAGGLSQMIMVAEEMHSDSLTIGLLHLARYFAIIMLMPLLITFMLS